MAPTPTPAHAAAQGYMEAERRSARRRRTARDSARRESARQAPPPARNDNGHEPSDPDYHICELGMFTRPQTQSINDAANRETVTTAENTFKHDDLIPQANAAESDRSRDYSRRSDTGVAYGHRDLRQSNTDFSEVLSHLHSNPYNYVGSAAFNSANSHTDRPAGAPGNDVTVDSFDAASHAGSYDGMQPVSHAPHERTEYHSAPLSATSPNGTHTSALPTSRNPQSVKDTPLDIMKRAMRGEL